MIEKRRRAMFLAELIPTILLFAVGSTIVTVAFGAILRSHREAADLANRYAILNDLFDCVRRDVRSAAAVTLKPATADAAPTIVVLSNGSRELLYEFQDGRVARSCPADHSIRDKAWKLDHTDVAVVVEQSPDGDAGLLKLTLTWQRRWKDDVQPRRRFDAAFRCAKEVGGE